MCRNSRQHHNQDLLLLHLLDLTSLVFCINQSHMNGRMGEFCELIWCDMLETSTGKVRRLNGQQCVWSSDLSWMDRQSSKTCCCLTKFNNSPLMSRKSHYLPLNNISRYRFLWLLPSFFLLLSGCVICFQLLCELCEWAVSMFIFRWRGSRQSTSHWQNKIIDLFFRANRNKVNGFLIWTCYWYTGLGCAIHQIFMISCQIVNIVII